MPEALKLWNRMLLILNDQGKKTRTICNQGSHLSKKNKSGAETAGKSLITEETQQEAEVP